MREFDLKSEMLSETESWRENPKVRNSKVDYARPLQFINDIGISLKPDRT